MNREKKLVNTRNQCILIFPILTRYTRKSGRKTGLLNSNSLKRRFSGCPAPIPDRF
jgi:hypothetical protein